MMFPRLRVNLILPVGEGSVTIRNDGKVIIEDADLDDAAKEFWKMVEDSFQTRNSELRAEVEALRKELELLREGYDADP